MQIQRDLPQLAPERTTASLYRQVISEEESAAHHNFLHRHKWTIFEAPARLNWFTSDDPVICLNYRSESDYDFNGGWGRERAKILFPLSPRHLMFTEIGTSSYPRRVPSRYRARLIRRMIAEHAHRSIYTQSEDNKVLQLRPRVEGTST
jgi:hypothetical protein